MLRRNNQHLKVKDMTNTKREIKFRAWSKTGKKMYQPHAFVEHYKIRKDLELQQFTGLKDKNGREIYSGDLLRHNEGSKSYEVMWNDMGFWELDDSCLGMVMRDNPNGLEIIGNIYEETPDLLTQVL